MAEWSDRDRREAGRRRARVGFGCALLVVLTAVGGVTLTVGSAFGAGWWVWENSAAIGARLGMEVVRRAFDVMVLPEGERAALEVQFERLARGYESGRVDEKDFGTLIAELGGPMLVGAIRAQVNEALPGSGLTAEEQGALAVELGRVANGADGQRIAWVDLQPVQAFTTEVDADGNSVARPLTDDDLRAVTVQLREVADRAGVAADAPDVGFSESLRHGVDRLLP